MVRPISLLALLLLAQPATALTVSVGPGCNVATLEAAIDLLEASSNTTHTIKLRSGSLSIANGELIELAASDLLMIGGYANCSDAQPSAGQRTVLDASGGAQGTAITFNAGDRSLQQWVSFKRITVRGGSSETGPFDNPEGGGVELRGHARLSLEEDSRIESNASVRGAGVYLVGARSDRPAKLLLREGSSISGNVASLYGGGAYCDRHGEVELQEGDISFNDAADGGGVYLRQNCRLLSQGVGAGQRGINNNRALRVGSSGGTGGGIYLDADSSTRTPIRVVGNNGNPFQFFNNSAWNGGGAYISNDGGNIINVEFSNTIWFGQRADFSAGMVLSGGVDALIRALPDCSYSFFGRPGCSALDDNDAVTGTGAITSISGASGSLPGTVTIERTRIENNRGAPAVALVAVTSLNTLSMEGSVIRNNLAIVNTSSAQNSRTLFTLNGQVPQAVRYSTVLANDTDFIFTSLSPSGASSGSTLSVVGSIVWAPGTQVWRDFYGPVTQFRFGDCFLSHSATGLPNGVMVADPLLEADLTPSQSSPALDICDDLDGAPGADFYGQARGFDQPAVADRYGRNDLGAVERRTILSTPIFANGFESL